jgi:isoleucyl-tRNA synthetase
MATLHECVVTLTQLLAPMVPFITEHAWQELVFPADPSLTPSVHLSDFPIAQSALVNRKLSAQVAMTRRVVEQGRAARAESGVKIRQPLGRALISAPGWRELPQEMKDQIADELNVLELADIADADGDLVDISVKANFKSLGAKYGSDVQAIAKLIASADATSLVRTLRKEKTTLVATYEINLDDLVVTEVPKSGWMVASHDGESVALDLTLTPELIQSGLVREVVRYIQEKRKSDGFEISDRINVTYNANSQTQAAITSELSFICSEVLATTFIHDATLELGENDLGLSALLRKS